MKQRDRKEGGKDRNKEIYVKRQKVDIKNKEREGQIKKRDIERKKERDINTRERE